MAKKVIIIGGGPAGYHSALSCRRHGLEVTLIEKEQIGGTCAHKGCIPTRSYLGAIKTKEQLIAANPSLSALLKLNPAELAETTAQKINQLCFGMDYLLRKNKVKWIQDTAMISGDKEVSLSDGSKLEADHIIVATGSEPKTMDNHSFHKLYTDEELLQLKEIPDTITIVGAGILGVELAVILQELGCKVTLAEREHQILPNWDKDVSSHMASYLTSLGIEIQTNVDTLPGENGVFCIGRRAKLPACSPAVSFDAPWLHFVGDATDTSFTADMAIAQGEEIGSFLSTGQLNKEENFHCQCLYTPLEAAMCGSFPSPEDKIAYLDIGYTASGVIFGTNLGMVKLVLDSQTNTLKGCHIVSHMASEIIQIAQLAIKQKMTAKAFATLIPPHPTEGEILKDALRIAL